MMLGCRPRRTRRIPRRRTERREKTAPRTLRTGESIADFESARQKYSLKFAYNPL